MRDGALGYDQKVRRLAALATEALPYPELSEPCRQALDKRIICDMFEGNAPYTPRYVLPDYELAMRNGLDYLELAPPTDLDDALAFLQIMYAHVPSVTTYPVYLGDLDKVLEPFVTDEMSDEELDREAPPFLDRDRPHAARRVRPPRPRSARQPRHPLDPAGRALAAPGGAEHHAQGRPRRHAGRSGARCRPHRVRNRQAALRQPPDDGRRPRRASTPRSAATTRSRSVAARTRWSALNLKEVALRHTGTRRRLPRLRRCPYYVELTAELAEARIRSLVDDQRFFDTHWLADRGPDRHRPVLGDVRHLRARRMHQSADGVRRLRPRREARYGHDADANALAITIVERVAELVAARPMPYCAGGGGRCFLHSQGGIDIDDAVTAGTRIPVGDEPGMLEHIANVRSAPSSLRRGHQRHLPRRRDRAAQSRGDRRHHPRWRSPAGCGTSRSTSMATSSSGSPAISSARATS